MSDISILLKAVYFAPDKHRDLRPKYAFQIPYINHPITVAQLLGGVLWRHTLFADNALLRQDLLIALGHASDPATAAEMRERILASELRDNEIFYIISSQMSQPETRQDMWNWSRKNLDALLDRVPSSRKGHMPRYFTAFCSREAADEVESVFNPVIDTLESGNRYLANSLEKIRLCTAFVDIHRSEVAQPH